MTPEEWEALTQSISGQAPSTNTNNDAGQAPSTNTNTEAGQASGTNSNASKSNTSAFTVQIGDLIMNVVSKPYPDENAEHNGSGMGQPNPTRITWTKENIVKTHEIPHPAHKTMRCATRTLWKLDLDFNVLEQTYLTKIEKLVNNVGPYFVRTYFKSMEMYILSFSATCDAGSYDAYHKCSLKLLERND
jgi:hypothetical protein